MKSTSSPDTQSLFNMIENESDGQYDLSSSHASSVSFFKNYSRYEDGGGADRLLQVQFLTKMLTKLFLEVIWWKWSRRLDPSEVEHGQKKRLISSFNGSYISLPSMKE